MNKQFVAIVIIVIAALGGVFMLASKSDKQSGSSGNNTVQTSNHTVGAGNKGVTLIEYGDFQCPACKSYYPIIKSIKEQYGDDIKFQFKHFPLVQIHPNAFIASRAAEAAGKQGKFFEMHDLLYENQDSWKDSSAPSTIFEGFATQLGLNIDQFKADVASEEIASIINADVKSGQALGANSTPTFVINDKKVDPLPKSADEFKSLIDEAIKNANSSN
ncbi:DsbA family protein [Candidatus Saccharibacteria bacterium]|nr:DsbA family protein [Candidatus Saccharibacteria bacterium]